ncbi:MAG: phosphate acetyltransferase [Actinomycetaceae bacterium]|nr:phosphate acetyltransferase [Actinomycetaceae bacterium]
MAHSVYVTAIEANAGIQKTALEYIAYLKNHGHRVGVFFAHPDGDIAARNDAIELAHAAGQSADLSAAWGISYQEIIDNEEVAFRTAIERFNAFAADYDTVVILGSTDHDPILASTVALDSHFASNFGANVVGVLSGTDRSAADIQMRIAAASRTFNSMHAPLVLAVVTGADSTYMDSHPSQIDTTAVFATGHDVDFATMSVEAYSRLESATEGSGVVTPAAFTSLLMERARAAHKRIVMPESDDERVLQAAHKVLRDGIADVILLGDKSTILARAQRLGLDLASATFASPLDAELIHKYATEFARLRAKKGVTYDQAVEQLTTDVSYFATMMVQMGDADGMVSGAVHTTANTIRPALQIIKTKPGTKLVSSVFLILLADKVWVFGDCAVNVNPTPSQVAEIAVSSAQTATQFGIDPRVAILSYSTGTSGVGPDVDAALEATQIAQQIAPDIPLEGPIQFDAAVSEDVARVKAPHSTVAGKATVFTFPSLSAGNIGYKAVQRAASAIAVGPILQGLNKPVNDLSRGALVDDIVNTVAITAIQAA